MHLSPGMWKVVNSRNPPFKNKPMCKSAQVQVHLDQRQQCENRRGWRPRWLQLTPFSLPHFPPAYFHSIFIPLSLSPLLPFSSAWDLLVIQRDDDLHVVKREESGLAAEHSFIPIFIDLIGQSDDVALVEAQFTLVLRIEVVKCFTARLLRCWWEDGERFHENGVIKWDLGNEGYWHSDRLRQRLMHHKWGKIKGLVYETKRHLAVRLRIASHPSHYSPMMYTLQIQKCFQFLKYTVKTS